MKTVFISSMIAAVLWAASPAIALPEINSNKPTDTAFMGDSEDKVEEIRILEAKDILLLDDQKLTDAYIDVVVEIDATKTFHSTSGFTPKEFKAYKGLLKYRLQLLFEIHRRNLQLPPTLN